MIFLTLEAICDINREWIQHYGGMYVEANSNLRDRPGLEYVLAAIQYPVFGVQRFPRLIDKAAALAWWVIEGHVFFDGNKRTGMQAARELLELNGVLTHFDTESVIDISVGVANGRIRVDELADLFLNFVERGYGDPHQQS